MDSVDHPLCVFCSGVAWPTLWMQELLAAVLPVLDNVTDGWCCRKWLARTATTNDLEVAHRVPQVRARGSDRERVCRWRLGSVLADHSDALQGTVGLVVRKRVAGAVKYGCRHGLPTRCMMKVPWAVRLRTMGVMQPVKNAPAALQDALLHTEVHVCVFPGGRSLCERDRCGTIGSPCATAVFFRWSQRPDMEPCLVCEASWQHSCRVSRWEALI